MSVERKARLLIVRLGAVGDVVRTLPLLHALRAARPETELGWVSEEPSAGLLREIAALDRLHVLPRRRLARQARRPREWRSAIETIRAFRAELREVGYDRVLDVHGTFKAAVTSRLAGSPRIAGLARGGSKEGARLLYDVAHPLPPEPMSRIERALRLGCSEGLLSGDPAALAARADHGLRFAAARVERARAWASTRPRPLIVLYPFASATRKGRRKRWPLERFLELADLLRGDGAEPVIGWGGPAELEEARAALERRAPERRPELLPATDLVELAEVLRQADLLVTGDTGPMHLAAASGTRVVALFGPSDPRVNAPWGDGHEVLRAEPLASLPAREVHEACRRAMRRAPASSADGTS